MTAAESLRQRRRELIGRKRALEESGGLELALVREELLDVNAQLRALTPRRREVRPERVDSDRAVDWQQYADWTRSDGDPARRAMLRAVGNSVRVLTDRQRQIWELREAGIAQADIARHLGVAKSTVSRTLRRAREVMGEETKRAAACLRMEEARLDMGDRQTARLVLSAVTSTQAAYLFLYFSNWMTLRQISTLTGTNRATVSRTVRLALWNISRALDGREAELANMDALDGLACRLYRETRDPGGGVPRKRRTAAHRAGGGPPGAPPGLTVSVTNGRWDRDGGRTGNGPGRPGALVALLLRQRVDVLHGLAGVFERLAY